jgi:hypothetical protein
VERGREHGFFLEYFFLKKIVEGKKEVWDLFILVLNYLEIFVTYY